MNDFRNEIYDLKIEGFTCFSDLDNKKKYYLINIYMKAKSYLFLDSIEALVSHEEMISVFKKRNFLDLDLPDNSNDEIDEKFIDFITSGRMDPRFIFTRYFISNIEEISDDIFNYFLNIKDEDLIWGISLENLYGNNILS